MGEKKRTERGTERASSTSHFRNGRPADTEQDNGAVIQTSWIVDASMSYCTVLKAQTKKPIADSARVFHTGQSALPDLRRTGQLTMVGQWTCGSSLFFSHHRSQPFFHVNDPQSVYIK